MKAIDYILSQCMGDSILKIPGIAILPMHPMSIGVFGREVQIPWSVWHIVPFCPLVDFVKVPTFSNTVAFCDVRLGGFVPSYRSDIHVAETHEGLSKIVKTVVCGLEF